MQEILYRGYKIEASSMYNVHGFEYEFVHENYDPTPMYLDDPPADNRCGHGHTIEECKAQIDEMEDA